MVVRPHENQGYEFFVECKTEVAVQILRMQKWKELYFESRGGKHLSRPLCTVKIMQLFETEDLIEPHLNRKLGTIGNYFSRQKCI